MDSYNFSPMGSRPRYMQDRSQSMGNDTMVLAMAYVPWQHFTQMYDLGTSLKVGTIFPELNKPFLGYGGDSR